MGRTVALKLIAAEYAENEAFRTRFLHESRVAGAINHPNVIPVYDAGEHDGLLYIAMRYVEGTDLRGLLDARCAAGARSRRLDRLAVRRRARRDACARPHPPRRQAGEHPARPAHDRGRRRSRLPVGLRPGQEPRLAERADADGAVHGHGRLRRARADPRQGRRAAHRRLRARLRPVRLPDRDAAVCAQGRLRDDHGPRQRRAAARRRAAAGHSRGGRGGRAAGAGQGAGGSLRGLRAMGIALRRAAGRSGTTPLPAPRGEGASRGTVWFDADAEKAAARRTRHSTRRRRGRCRGALRAGCAERDRAGAAGFRRAAGCAASGGPAAAPARRPRAAGPHRRGQRHRPGGRSSSSAAKTGHASSRIRRPARASGAMPAPEPGVRSPGRRPRDSRSRRRCSAAASGWWAAWSERRP